MKRILFISLFALTLSINVLAQSEFDEPKWTTFEPEREEFTVNFPNAAVVSTGRTSDAVLAAHYHAVQNKTFFAVFSTNDGSSSFVPELKGLAIADSAPKDIEIDGIKGQRYDFKGSDDYEHSFIAIQTPVRFYIFHVISETRDNSMVEEFLGSIKLTRPLSIADTPVAPAAGPSKASLGDILKPRAPGTGASGGFASGNAGGPIKLEDTVAPPKYTKVDSAVTILAKTSPSYTDLARKYMISGTVKLRITFEKNREIGNITAISKLPLGLTQSAIRAARQIQFAPALRHGEPYASTKVVEYNFNLY